MSTSRKAWVENEFTVPQKSRRRRKLLMCRPFFYLVYFQFSDFFMEITIVWLLMSWTRSNIWLLVCLIWWVVDVVWKRLQWEFVCGHQFLWPGRQRIWTAPTQHFRQVFSPGCQCEQQTREQTRQMEWQRMDGDLSGLSPNTQIHKFSHAAELVTFGVCPCRDFCNIICSVVW